jgi:mevalonate kinase
MPAFSSSAPAKIILFGEHAVVYGKPAIAVPVRQLSAKAILKPGAGEPVGRVKLHSAQIGLDSDLTELPHEHPVRAIIEATLDHLGISALPACSIRISSTIPVATGLGSGAAVSVAIARAVAAFLGHPLSDEAVSRLALQVEKIHHGTPSGIDNSVIAYNQPIYFVKDKPIEALRLGHSLQFMIADTGVPSLTRETVGEVRKRWQKDPEGYNTLFDGVAKLSKKARKALERGDDSDLGRLMDDNQTLLERIGVSTPGLERLITAARAAGALGAKLSGGGGGGNIISLVSPAAEKAVGQALKKAGAARVLYTQVD